MLSSVMPMSDQQRAKPEGGIHHTAACNPKRPSTNRTCSNNGSLRQPRLMERWFCSTSIRFLFV